MKRIITLESTRTIGAALCALNETAEVCIITRNYIAFLETCLVKSSGII